MDNKNNFMQKQTLALIATYPMMSEIFKKVAKENGVEALDYYASFDDAAVKALEIETKVDAILSRGGTAAFIRKVVNIPVITIPITPFDVLQVIDQLPPSVKTAAFIHYRADIPNIRDIEKMYGVRIVQYTFTNEGDIFKAVNDAMENHIRTVIGGNVAVRYANSLGLNGLEVSAGEYSVHKAFEETIDILRESQNQKDNAARLEAAFNSLSEGVIVTDDKKNIIICNDPAAAFLDAPRQKNDDTMGSNALEDESYRKVFSRELTEISYVKKHKRELLATSHRQIIRDNKFVGVVSTFENVTKIQEMQKQIRHEIHTRGFEARHYLDDIITCDKGMNKVKDMAALIAHSDASVLIEGESGTGKEMFAQGIHNESGRADGPFVAVNCAAIPAELLESELFGYEEGAFTGARKQGKKGLFELADCGTLFLDEIGEVPLELQARLLRVIQEREIMRVGGSKIISIDVRIISATNHDLLKKVGKGEFREDLYYRINVFNLIIPPLRARRSDIKPLAENYAVNYMNGLPDGWDEYLQWLIDYSWPGNVRELQNIVERLVVLSSVSKGIKLEKEQIFTSFLSEFDDSIEKTLLVESAQNQPQWSVNISFEHGLKGAVAQFEKSVIQQEMDRCSDQDEVSRKLGIGKTTLWRKLNEK
ncbi:MAG: sigma 54-interacting transcriptional regulator [Eubacteriaceae bacterium]|nr:sigma 54-interacting transcriptional regulator [Eubacteriaceae bacterium]